MRHSGHAASAVLVIITMLAGCGAPSPTPSPSASAQPSTPAAPAATPTSAPPPSAAISPAPSSDPFLGSIAKTVSGNLRVRSLPAVSDDSIKYEPLLPTGTKLQVVGGPVEASGYTWYEVEPVGFDLGGGVRRGWVASADHDGTPWIAVADPPITGLTVATSDVARAPAKTAEAKRAAASVNAFAVDLYKRLLTEDAVTSNGGNDVFSPTSIALALGMVRAGAKGETATQMDKVLHTTGWDALGPALNSLDQALASRNASWKDYDEVKRQLALRLANTTFAQRDWTVEQPFLDAIAADFGAGLNLVDYASDPAAARDTINAWVKRHTEDRIPKLLEPKDVTELTRLYLVNAIYMKAEWDQWFQDGETTPKTFTRLDGSTIKVPTMLGFRGGLGPIAPYATGDGWKAVELGYRGPTDAVPLAMTIVMPDDLKAFEKSLDAKTLASITAKLDKVRAGWYHVKCPPARDPGCYPYDMRLTMPKFSTETRTSLVKLLKGLGMPLAFQPGGADFGGIHVPSDLNDAIYISAVIHQANIDVDEHGTEAAAATAVGAGTGGGPSPLKNVTFRVDHPFIYLIRDLETGAIVFMGRVADPSLAR